MMSNEIPKDQEKLYHGVLNDLVELGRKDLAEHLDQIKASYSRKGILATAKIGEIALDTLEALKKGELSM